MARRPEKWIDPDKEFVVHPDILESFQNYNGSGCSFASTFKARGEVLAHDPDMIYHDDSHDREMEETARERTRVYAAKGNKWPVKRR